MKTRMKLMMAAAIMGTSPAFASSPLSTRQDSIRAAIDYQISHYPASQLRDVYKNFMQDNFGPGHILNDTTKAGAYLRSELRETTRFEGPDYEPTGFKGNFIRVNISLVKDGTIPYDTYFRSFVSSVQGIVPPAPEEWIEEWNEIVSEINGMNLLLPNRNEDERLLAGQLERGDFVVHHSEAFNEASNFHYRIFSRENFEKDILPLLSSKNK